MACTGIDLLDMIKQELGIASTDITQDAFLTTLSQQVIASFERYLDRKIMQATWTEYYIGNNTQELMLRQRPIASDGIASVYQDDNAYWGTASGAFPSTTLLVSGESYALETQSSTDGLCHSGLLYRIGDVWPMPWTYQPGRIALKAGPAVGNIKITYTAGFEELPDDLAYAIFMQTAFVRRKRLGQLPGSESYGDGAGSYSVSYQQMQMQGGPGFLCSDAAGILAMYRNVAVF